MEEKRALIESFLNGEVTSEEVIAQLEALRDNRHQYQLEKVGAWIDFMDRLSEDQQSTLISILEEIQIRQEERRAEMEESFGDSAE